MGFLKKIFGIFSTDSTSTYNKSEKSIQNYNKSEKPSPKWNDFFGIDLTSAPNDSWTYEGEEGNSKYFKYIGNSLSDLFDSCLLIADGNKKTMNFTFDCDFDTNVGFDILWEIEKSIMGHSLMTRGEIKSKYLFKVDDEEYPVFFDMSGNRIIYKYMPDEFKIKIFVFTKFYNEPKVNSFSLKSLMEEMDSFEKYQVIVEKSDDVVDFFQEKNWIDDGKPLLMASVLADGKMFAFDMDSMVAYFEYQNAEIENKFREGNTGVVAVSDYKIEGNKILVDLWVSYKYNPDVDENTFSAHVTEIESKASYHYRL